MILDTETTGLDEKAEIIEIAIIDLNGKILLNQRIKPLRKKRFAKATNVHGIEYSDLRNEPTMDQVSDRIINILSGKVTLIYNAKFDVKMLDQSFEAAGVDLEYNLKFDDVMQPYTDYLGRSRWAKLPGGDHSALGDCFATLDIIKEMAGVSGSNNDGDYDSWVRTDNVDYEQMLKDQLAAQAMKSKNKELPEPEKKKKKGCLFWVLMVLLFPFSLLYFIPALVRFVFRMFRK